MIALDTSSVRRFLSGESGRDVALVDAALASGQAVLPPVVVTELLSEPTMAVETARILGSIDTLPIAGGFWQRAGALRASVLRRGHKARLADVLVAQSCIDSDVPLVTTDRDFRHFLAAGLRLLR